MKKIIYTTITILTALLILSGCPGDLNIKEKPAAGEGKGFVTLSLEAIGRTILPTTTAFGAFEVVFTPNLSGEGDYREQEPHDPVKVVSLSSEYELEVGSWTLQLKAFGRYAETTPIATGTAAFVVGNQTTVPVNVPLTFDSMAGSADSGIFRWQITNHNLLQIDSVPIHQTEITLICLNGNTARNKSFNSESGTQGVEAGYYWVTVRQERNLITPFGSGTTTGGTATGAIRAVFDDIVHIYPHHTTVFNHTFGANDYFNGISEVWLVGLNNDWNTPPGMEPTVINPNGTYTWKIDSVAATSYFRFRLTDTSLPGVGIHHSSAWFVPQAEPAPASTSVPNPMFFAPFSSPGEGSSTYSKAWSINGAGYYIITLDPVFQQFEVQKPLIVENIIIHGGSSPVRRGGTRTFTADINGKNIPSGAAVAWSIVDPAVAIDSGTSINPTSGVLTVATAEGNDELEIRATYNGVYRAVVVALTTLPALPTPAGLNLTNTGNGTWSYSANDASTQGYTLQLYNGNTPTGDPVEKDRGTFSHNFLSEMRKAPGTYSFTVIANGDNDNTWASSDESLKSPTQTIAALVPANVRWSSNEARWDALTGAVSYQVELFKNGTAASVGSRTVNAPTALVDLTAELVAGKTGVYTFTLKAISSPTGLYLDSAVVTVQIPKGFINLGSADTGFGNYWLADFAVNPDGVIVAVGNDGMIRRHNGTTWASPTNNPTTGWGGMHYQAVTWGNPAGAGTFAAVGRWGNIVTSTDGQTWAGANDVFSGWNDKDNACRWYAVAWNGNSFITSGLTNNWGGWGALVATSTNGTSWSLISGGVAHAAANNTIYGMANNGSYVMAVGQRGRAMYSTNHGVTWTWLSDAILGTVNEAGRTATDAVFGNNTWVVVGHDGTIATVNVATPTDGSTSTGGWTRVFGDSTRFDTLEIASVAYANGMFVIVGNDGRISTSVNGTNWVAMPVGTAAGQTRFVVGERINSVRAVGNNFVIGGNNRSTNASKIVISD